MNQNDRDQLCAFFQRSRYDIIQARQGDEWGPVYTFSPCNARAAQGAARMMGRMHQGEPLRVRHARRARLQDRRRQVATDIVVVTELPERAQTVVHLEDAVVLRVDFYLREEALDALEAEFAHSPR